MSKFTAGPWAVDHSNGCTYVCTEESEDNLCRVTAHNQIANARLIASAPDMFAAIDAADTAFAVLNVQDLGGQARQCIREAWPLVQSARAKALPDSGYADAVKEAQQHEIARLDKLVFELQEALECALNYIDEIPSEVAASFPTMPGFDREWADGLLHKHGASHDQA